MPRHVLPALLLAAALGACAQRQAGNAPHQLATNGAGRIASDATGSTPPVVVVAPTFTARSELLASLGLEPVEQLVNGSLVGTYVPADPMGATAVAGVWVAGNVAALQAQVIGSAAAGLNAGAAINADLVAEDARAAVAAARELAAVS